MKPLGHQTVIADKIGPFESTVADLESTGWQRQGPVLTQRFEQPPPAGSAMFIQPMAKFADGVKRAPEILHRIINRDLLPIFACEQGYRRGVEIGTFRGEFAKHIHENWPGELWTVDPFENQPEAAYRDGCNHEDMAEIMREALERLDPWIKDNRCHVMRMSSVEASRHFTAESLDFVYLDGNHSESVVSRELAIYWPLIRSGGLLATHDFYDRHDAYQECGVFSAAMDFAQRIGVLPHVTPDTTAIFIKP